MSTFDFIKLPGKPAKPREQAITSLIDKGLDLDATRQLVSMAADYIDIVKLGFGTAVLYEEILLREKIQLLSSANIKVCPGGTLFELAFLQGHFKDYLTRCCELGFNCIEISDGEVIISSVQKNDCIKQALDAGFTVLSEVGRKEAARDKMLTLEQRLIEIEQELESGVWKVILEARESGNVGIFSQDTTVKEDEVELIIKKVDAKHLIFEAPIKAQQIWLIKKFGNSVNLGNVQPGDVFALESLRRGLRADTLEYFHGK